MDLLLDLIGTLAAAARRVWPGALAAALGGYIGWQWMGFFGFLIAAGVGALGGTWAGAKLGLVPVKAATGNPSGDHLLSAAGAFAIVVVGYMLLQFVYIALAVAAVIAIAMFWLQS